MIYRETQLNLCSNSSTHVKYLWDFLLKSINQKNTHTISHCRIMWGNVGVCGLLLLLPIVRYYHLLFLSAS